MADTLLEMRTEVRDYVRRTVGVLPDARINKWINRSVIRICNNNNFKEMEDYDFPTTTADVKRYAHPPTLKDIYSLTIQDGASSTDLIYVQGKYFDKQIPRSEETTTQRPYLYIDYGTEYELYPIADATYTINRKFWAFPVDLVLDADTSSLSRKDHLIVAGATAFGFKTLREFVASEGWEAVFTRYQKEAKRGNKRGKTAGTRLRGFRYGGESGMVGDYWKNPFIGRYR